MKKLAKKIKKDTSPAERRFGVILERIDSNVRQISEGQIMLDGNVNRIDKKVDDMKLEMDYKFEIVFDELHLIRNEQVKRQEFVILEKRVLELEKRQSKRGFG